MSFAEEFKEVWEVAIKPAIEEDTEGNPKARRVDSTTLTGNIVFEIFDGIAHAKIVFADISVCDSGEWKGQRNGNVMYELCLTHAVRQKEEIVIVRSDNEEINFDIVQIRVQKYSRVDLNLARKDFAHFIKNNISSIDNLKSLKVENAFRSLDGNCLRLLPHSEAFYIPEPKNSEEAINFLRDYDAIRNFLSLGMLWCDSDPATHRYAYHWTNFGKWVRNRAGF
jgi:hypothetical protein